MQADFALDYDVLTVERPHKVYLMARLVSPAAPSTQRRRPLNLSLVIDRSGSMAGEKIAYIRQAAQFLVQNLGAADRLGVVLYNDSVEVLSPPELMIHKDALIQRIAGIKTGGTTNLSGGWLEGCNLVMQNLGGESLNRVILMTDGLANRGISDPARLVALAGQKYEQGISTTAMGLGADFNEDLLMAMADAGGGAFYFIETPEAAPLIFQEELSGLLNVVGQNLIIHLELTEHITGVSQLNAYPMQANAQRVSFRLGDLFGEEVKTLVLELSIPALRQIGECQIGTLHFEYDEIGDTGTTHQARKLPVRVNVAAPGQLPVTVDNRVRRSVLLLQAAQARRDAVKYADEGKYQHASQILRAAADAIERSGLADGALSEEEQALLKQAESMERGAAAYDSYSRKSMATQALYTMTDRHQGTQMLRTRETQRVYAPPPAVEKKPGTPPAAFMWNHRIFPVDRDVIKIGRAAQNDVVIERRTVSRFHCQLKREGEQVIVEDMSSTNGTFVNDARLNAPHTLSAGDVVRIGDELLVFQE